MLLDSSPRDVRTTHSQQQTAQLSSAQSRCVCVLYRKDAWFSKYVRSKLTPSSLYRVHVWASPPHVEGGQPGSKSVFCLFSDDVVYGCLVPFVPTSEGNTVSTFSHSLSGRPHVAFPFHFFFLFVLSSLLWETLWTSSRTDLWENETLFVWGETIFFLNVFFRIFSKNFIKKDFTNFWL